MPSLPAKGASRVFLRDHRLLLHDLGVGASQIGDVRIHCRLAHGLDFELRLVAAQIDGVELRRGFQRFKPRIVRILAQLDENLPRLDVLPRLEVNLLHDARGFERKVRAIDGAERADR